MGDALAVDESQSFEELVGQLAYRSCALPVQLCVVFLGSHGQMLTADEVVATQAAWHVVAD